jgi:hypothetical protein
MRIRREGRTRAQSSKAGRLGGDDVEALPPVKDSRSTSDDVDEYNGPKVQVHGEGMRGDGRSRRVFLRLRSGVRCLDGRTRG